MAVQKKSEIVYRGVCPKKGCNYKTYAQDNEVDAKAQLKDHMQAAKHNGTQRLEKKSETVYRPVCNRCGWKGYVEDEKSDAEYQLQQHMETHERNS
jgi:hypothetical protein